MADESLEIPECEFTHAADTPRSSLYYNLPILTEKQRGRLNKLKCKILVEDERYLAHHPEVSNRIT